MGAIHHFLLQKSFFSLFCSTCSYFPSHPRPPTIDYPTCQPSYFFPPCDSLPATTLARSGISFFCFFFWKHITSLRQIPSAQFPNLEPICAGNLWRQPAPHKVRRPAACVHCSFDVGLPVAPLSVPSSARSSE